jgi:hypothetical protein
MAVILVGILTTKPLIFIKMRAGGRAGGHEQGQEDQLVIYKERGRDLV